MQHDPIVTLVDILQAAYRVQEFLLGIDELRFSKDHMVQSAVIYKLTIIGEATSRLTEAFRRQHPEIPWQKMKSMRNFLIHDYNGVLLPYVWEAATLCVPDLIEKVRPLVPPEEENG